MLQEIPVLAEAFRLMSLMTASVDSRAKMCYTLSGFDQVVRAAM